MPVRAPDLPREGAHLVEQLMNNAIYSTLSRRQAGLITSGDPAGMASGDRHPPEGIQAIADRRCVEDAG